VNRAAGLVMAGTCALLEPIFCLLTTWIGLLTGVGSTEGWDTPRRRRRGLIVILGGIEGPSLYARAIAVGILRSGWRGAVVVYRWNRGWPVVRAFPNLMDTALHERRAERLCAIGREHRQKHGDTHVGLIGHSGGCWIIVRALETLGREEAIGRAVLCAPAISPGYDATRAAAACRGGLAALGGPGDVFFLGLGTSVLGTSDRRWGPAAGLVGWRIRAAGFEDVRWRPAFARDWYVGNHVSVVSPAFVRRTVGPWLAGRGERLG